MPVLRVESVLQPVVLDHVHDSHDHEDDELAVVLAAVAEAELKAKEADYKLGWATSP
jgi:hypothetical protein